jgi:hypothetical protein
VADLGYFRGSMKNYQKLVIVGPLVLLSMVLACNLYAQPAFTSESSNDGLKFIEDIELTPRKISQKSTQWRHGGTVTYPVSTELPSVISNSNNFDIENCSPVVFKYAMMLDIPVESLQWEKGWFTFLEQWIGTPYHFGGSSINGTDCSGFSGNLYNTLYSKKLARSSRDQANQCSFISPDSLELGDLVFFRNGLFISHVGVYLTNGYFVHASTSQGVTISHLQETYYKKRFYRAGRINSESDYANAESKKQDEP